MKTLCRTEGDKTSFIIADLDARYHEAARALYYQLVAGGFAKTYPADTPHRLAERVAAIRRYLERAPSTGPLGAG